MLLKCFYFLIFIVDIYTLYLHITQMMESDEIEKYITEIEKEREEEAEKKKQKK